MILQINGHDIALEKGSVKITYAVNDVGDPAKRDGAYSDTFDLPKSSEISEILGYPDNFNIFDTDASPYKKLSCNIVEGNVILKGFAIVQASEKTYKINVFGDNVNWFDIVSNAKIADVDLSEYDHLYSQANIVAAGANTEGYTYPVIDYDNGLKDRVATVTADDILLYDMYPAVFVHTLLKKIFKQTGYKLAGEFISHPLYKRLIIPFSNKELIVLSNRNALATYSEDTLITIPASYTPVNVAQKIIFDNDNILPGFHGAIDNYNGILGTYTADSTIILQIFVYPVYDGGVAVDGFPRVHFAVFINGAQYGIEKQVASGDRGQWLHIPVDAGDVIEIWISQRGAMGDTITINMHAGSYVEFIELDPAKENGLMQLNLNMPDMTQGDLISALFNKFQLITTTNEYTKTVYFNFFKQVPLNIKNSDDWSEKIDCTDPAEIEFAIDSYGQKNNFKYSESEEESEVEEYNKENNIHFGDGVSEFNNEALEPETDLIELPFAATINHDAFTGIEGDAVSIPTIALGSDPRIMIYMGLVDITDFSNLEELYFINDTVTQLPYAFFDKPPLEGDLENFKQSLSFSTPTGYNTRGLLETYFTAVKNMVERPRKITALFNLKSVDIMLLDFLKPKYIDRFKSYFYLSSVNEYSGEQDLTECELIKLSVPQVEGTDIPGSILMEYGDPILGEDGELLILE